VENLVLQCETVEVFRRGCAMSIRAEGNAIALLFVKTRRFDVTPRALLIEHLMLTAAREERRESAAAAQLPVFFCSPDEPALLCFNTFCAAGVICIVVWSWRTASTREVSG
jgi:hypothetical protein